MAFVLPQMLGWMEERGVAYTLRRADGSVLDTVPTLAVSDVVFDSREAGPQSLFCAVPGEHTHGVRFLGAALAAGAPVALVEGDALVVEGSRAIVIEVVDARAALNAAARGWLDLHAPRIVGITGSNGKTTTKDLTAAALQGTVRAAASPGNRNSGWGLPAAVLGFDGDEDVLVLEMGASSPGEIERLCAVARPWMGCITNIGPAHLEFFGDEAGVAQTKGALVASLPADGVAVLNRDDAYFDVLAARTSARVVSFGHDARADLRITAAVPSSRGLALTVAGEVVELPLFGAHNALNAAAALAMAQALGVQPRTALERMRAVSLSPHRSRVLEVGGRCVVDDCYNANPASMIAALESFARTGGATIQRVAVLGDMGELGAHADAAHREVIARALGHRALGCVVVVGERMARAARDFDDARLQVHGVVDPASIAHLVVASTTPGDAILLKASRSVALERVLEQIGIECAEGTDAPGGQA